MEKFSAVVGALQAEFFRKESLASCPLLCYNFRIFETWEGRPLFAKTYGATTLGIDGRIIDVEVDVDVSPGLPGFELVGFPDTSVKESKERVRTAIRNSSIQLRQERVTVNLAPADVRKDSSGLDLPIAVGLLASYGMVPEAAVHFLMRFTKKGLVFS